MTSQFTQEEIERLAKEENTFVYGWKDTTSIEEENVLSPDAVLAYIDRCLALGSVAKCMQDPVLKEFATKTHPRIFQNIWDAKKLRLVKSMVFAAQASERTPDKKESIMTNLHLKFMGYGRKDRRRFMRNMGAVKRQKQTKKK